MGVGVVTLVTFLKACSLILLNVVQTATIGGSKPEERDADHKTQMRSRYQLSFY